MRIESKPRARKEPGQVNPLNPQGIKTVTLDVYVTSDLRPPHYCYVVKKLVNEKSCKCLSPLLMLKIKSSNKFK